MWMGIIGLPEMRMYWARNMTFSLSAFPQTMPRRRFEAIQKYFHSFNRRAIPKGNPDKLMIIRPVLDFIIGKCRSLYVPTRNLSIDEGMLKWKGRLSIRVYNPLKPIKVWHKILFFMRGKNWLRARLHYLSRGHVNTARYCLQFAGASLRAWLSRLHGQLLYICVPGGRTV